MEDHVIPERFWTNDGIKFKGLSTLEFQLKHNARRQHAYHERPSQGDMDIEIVKDSKYFFC